MVDWQFIAFWAGVPTLLLVVVVAIAVTDRRRGRAAGPAGLTRAATIAVSLVGTGALLVAEVGAVGIVGSAVQVFSAEPFTVRDLPIGNAPTPGFLERSEAAVAGGYESVWIDVVGVPLGARWMFFAAAALPLAATTAIGVAIVWLAISLLRGHPFARRLPIGIGIAAVAVGVADMGAQITASVGRSLVIEHLDPRVITAGGTGNGPYEGLASVLNLDPASLAWAFGLALVAVAFRIGSRLQQETETLV